MKIKSNCITKSHSFALASLFFLSLSMVMNKTGATNYYVSATGSDAANGVTKSTAWLTIGKVNGNFSSFAAGDSILFKRGDTFYGSIVVTASGASGNPIVIGAYGTGAKPVITGFSDATGWTSTGTNLWESSAIVNANKPNMVTINAKPVGMGRYPNTGYLTFESCVDNISITDNQLSGTPNWTGGEVIIRKNHWTLSRDVITNHSGNTITYTGTSGYNSTSGYGYFVQNHLSTLDVQNEWYFNNSTKKITVYSATSPTGVKVASRDILLDIGVFDYIHVDNLSFEGANVAAVNGGSLVNQAVGITVKNCTINYSGKEAVYFTNSVLCTIDNCVINNSLNNAILFRNQGGWSDSNTIRYNKITNSGVIPGMNDGGISNQGITVYGSDATIEYNTVDTTGYLGIAYYRDNSKVRHNVVRYYCFVKDDGAGIYTWTGYDGLTVNTGRDVIGNVVSGGIGASAGTLDGSNTVHGIYIDDGSKGVVVDSNTVYNTTNGGIYLHNCQNITVRHNTVYNCNLTQLLIVHDNYSPNTPVRSIIMQDNKFVAKLIGAEVVTIRTTLDDLGSFGSVANAFDNNYYYKPIDDNNTKFKTTKMVGGNYVYNNYTFDAWKAAFPVYEVNSIAVPIKFDVSITSANIDDYVRFEYNETSIPKTISLNGFQYKTMDNVIHTGTYTIPPFRSVIFLKYGGNQPPLIRNQSFQIAKSSINGTSVGTVAASDSDAGQTLTYSIVSGNTNGAFTINAATGMLSVANTTGLTSDFTLVVKVADNGTGTLSNQATVTINLLVSGGNQSPSIVNQTFQLAKNSTNGKSVGTIVASDPDAGQTLEYSIVSGNTNGAFTINASTGLLSVANATALNSDFALVVKVQDNGTGALSNQATITINVISTPGINKTIKVYPNPVFDELIIEIQGNTDSHGFEILNLSGQIVYKGNFSERIVVPIASFSPGIYLIKLENGQSFEYKKFVKL